MPKLLQNERLRPEPMTEHFTNNFARLIPHLTELRKRLLMCVFITTSLFIVLLPFANFLYSSLAAPLLKYLPQGSTIIATHIVSPFWAPLKLTFIFSLVLTAPFLLHQAWQFISPALYQKERKFLWGLFFSSIILFYLGLCFAYFAVFPLIYYFLIKTAPHGVTVMPDISLYLDFALQILLTFGISFEIPIAVILLIKTGITTVTQLEKQRPYMIIASFILGMLLAPDVLSQTALAIPLWLLFEAGLFFAKKMH